jgi:hypothetical protein
MTPIRFITVGCGHRFDPARFNRPLNAPEQGCPNKPYGGLWASPTNSEFGWRDWRRSAEWEPVEDSFEFALKPNSRIVRINTEEDCTLLPWVPAAFSVYPVLDFEALAERADALWVTNEGRKLPRFMGWDCETLLVLNEGALDA